VVRRYIADAYGYQPDSTCRRRSLWLDSGGMVVRTDPVLRLPMPGGWHVQLRSLEVPWWAAAWEERLARPPKVYPGGVEAVRVGARFYTAIMRPAEAAHLLGLLRPHVQASTLAGQAQLATLNALPNVYVGSALPAVQE